MTNTKTLNTLWREWLQPVALIAAVMLPFRSAIADWNVVPTGSMNPTIVEGDRIFINKLAYDLKIPFTTVHLAQWADPQRGEIAVFYAPDDGMRLVKRVIGLPGDVLELRDERLYINGEALSYAPLASDDAATVYARELLGVHPHMLQIQPGLRALRSFGPVTVPQGSYFMMGDNRDNSRDSRYFGFVARDQIVGRALAVVASLDPERYYLPRTERFFKALP